MKKRHFSGAGLLLAGVLGPLVYDRLAGHTGRDVAFQALIYAGAWFVLTLGAGLVVADVMAAWEDGRDDLTRRDAVIVAGALRLGLVLALIGLSRPWFVDHPALVLADFAALFALARWRPFGDTRED